jgi:hypothetical protein
MLELVVEADVVHALEHLVLVCLDGDRPVAANADLRWVHAAIVPPITVQSRGITTPRDAGRRPASPPRASPDSDLDAPAPKVRV